MGQYMGGVKFYIGIEKKNLKAKAKTCVETSLDSKKKIEKKMFTSFLLKFYLNRKFKLFQIRESIL